MVEPIGVKRVTAADRGVPSKPTNVAAPATPAAASPTAAVPGAADNGVSTTGGIDRSLFDEPPVNAERVARIRSAIQRNSYPVVPETIADRLIALKLGWTSHEPS